MSPFSKCHPLHLLKYDVVCVHYGHGQDTREVDTNIYALKVNRSWIFAYRSLIDWLASILNNQSIFTEYYCQYSSVVKGTCELPFLFHMVLIKLIEMHVMHDLSWTCVLAKALFESCDMTSAYLFAKQQTIYGCITRNWTYVTAHKLYFSSEMLISVLNMFLSLMLISNRYDYIHWE